MSLDITSGETLTVDSGTTQAGAPVNIAGELNIAGQLNGSSNQQLTASGVGDSSGTADLQRVREVAAAGSGAAEGLRGIEVDSGETQTIESGATQRAFGLDIGGQLNIAGEININAPRKGRLTRGRELDASGTGEATGTATLERNRTMSAGGSGTATGTARLLFSGLLAARGTGSAEGLRVFEIDSGETETVESGTTRQAYGLNISGELNIAGEINVNTQRGRLTRGRELDASGTGEATGTATLERKRALSAAGVGEAVASMPLLVESIPMIRGDSTGLEFDTSESFDLNAETD